MKKQRSLSQSSLQPHGIVKDYSTRAAQKLIDLAILRPPQDKPTFELHLKRISRKQLQQEKPPAEPKSLWAAVQELIDVPLCDASLIGHEQAEDEGDREKRERHVQRDILALMMHANKWRNELDKTLSAANASNATTLRVDREQFARKIDSMKIIIDIAS